MQIKAGYKPKVLLLGNGINRAHNFASWDELIKSIQCVTLTQEEQKEIENIPYPLQAVILTKDSIDEKMKEIASELTALKATPEEERLLCKFSSIPFDTILTTNYTYELEKSLNPEFTCKVGCRSKFRKTTEVDAGKETISLLHTYFQVKDDVPIVWHVHGETAKPNTMILGHYYYGKLLSKIQQYITSLKKRIGANRAKEQGIKCMSWIDYFMLGDIYIVGLGLHPSEFDLWWLINCKKRHFPETNVILYKPDISVGEKLLAEAYNIKVDSEGLEETDFKSYYKMISEKLSLIISEQ